jgi:hypothetical protein
MYNSFSVREPDRLSLMQSEIHEVGIVTKRDKITNKEEPKKILKQNKQGKKWREEDKKKVFKGLNLGSIL